jgi:hypothetical protein
MSDELQITRRGVLQMVGAIAVTASFAARRPLLEPVAEAELTDTDFADEEPFVTDHARGTKLEQFLRSRGIKPAHLARESGYSRQHLLRIRLGRMKPACRCVVLIVAACRRLYREPVSASDLFQLMPSDVRAIERVQRRLTE